MRRRNDGDSSTSSTPSVERSTRRSTRRGRKTPSRTPEPERKIEEKVSETEIDGDNKKDRDSSSDRDSEGHANIPRRRTRTTKERIVEEPILPKRRRGTRSDKCAPIAEENGDEANSMKAPPENTQSPKKAKPDEEVSCHKNKEDRRSDEVVPEKEVGRRKRVSESHAASTKKEIIEDNLPKDSEESIKTTSKDTESMEVVDEDNCKKESSEPVVNDKVDPEKIESEAEVEKVQTLPAEQEEEKNEAEKKGSEESSSKNHSVTATPSKSHANVDSKSEEKSRERRSRFDEKPIKAELDNLLEEKENESNKIDEQNSVHEKKSEKPLRKRKWLSRRDSKPQVLAISTDSLRNLISDVEPVPLSDIKLESSPEPEEVVVVKEEEKRVKERSRNREKRSKERETKREEKSSITSNRKVSLVSSEEQTLQRPPSPPQHQSSNILYITNLVRPFTVLQLKGLLARTGKIVENGFWIDRIKSKCYVKYDTEDQAVETRHALHGVRWPTSNPKCLNVDFGSEAAMEKAMESTLEEGPRFGPDAPRDNRIIGTGWDKERFEFDEKKNNQVSRPVREWDVGKKEELEREMERSRDTSRDKRRSSASRDKRRSSTSASPARKFKKKDNEPPLRLLDDLFRKTKTTPCIYWLPLTPEQILEKEEVRRKRMLDLEELRKEREKERERERERERRRERSDRDRRRSRSRERRRY